MPLSYVDMLFKSLQIIPNITESAVVCGKLLVPFFNGRVYVDLRIALAQQCCITVMFGTLADYSS